MKFRNQQIKKLFPKVNIPYLSAYCELITFFRKVKKMSKRKETVIKVIDGDTFRTSTRKHSVRLSNVNAPEKGHRGSAKAANDLKGLIAGRKVQVETVARDKYGRAIANVKVDGKSVNNEMKQKLRK